MTADTIAFAGSKLDRADHVRQDPDALAALMNHRARLLLLEGLDPVISDDGSLGWGSLADADPEAELVFLGLNGGEGHFAAVPRAGSTSPPIRACSRRWPVSTASNLRPMAARAALSTGTPVTAFAPAAALRPC